MVAIGKKDEMAKVESKKPTISDGDSATESDSEGSDIPELEDNTGAQGEGKETIPVSWRAISGWLCWFLIWNWCLIDWLWFVLFVM